MAVNNEAVKGLGGLPLFTELPRRGMFSETRRSGGHEGEPEPLREEPGSFGCPLGRIESVRDRTVVIATLVVIALLPFLLLRVAFDIVWAWS